MEFKDLKSGIESGQNILSFQEIIEGKQIYKPLGEKYLMCKEIIEYVIDSKNGYYFKDLLKYEVWKNYYILSFYFGVKFGENIFTLEDYDYLEEKGLLNTLYSKDISIFNNMLDDLLEEELKSLNSLSNVITETIKTVTKELEGLMDEKKLNKMIKSVNKAVEKNPNLKEIVSPFVNNSSLIDSIKGLVK